MRQQQQNVIQPEVVEEEFPTQFRLGSGVNEVEPQYAEEIQQPNQFRLGSEMNEVESTLDQFNEDEELKLLLS